MIDYVLKASQLLNVEAGKKVAYPVNVRVHTEADMAKELAGSNIGLSEAESVAAIAAINGITRKWVSQGDAYNGSLMNIHFSVPGSFGEGEMPNKAAIRVTPCKPLIAIADGIHLRKVEPANTILVDEVKDIASGTINNIITIGQDIIISGYNIKLAGDSPLVGIWFEDTDGSKPKVTTIVMNDPSKLIVQVPLDVNDCHTYYMRITTFFSGRSTQLLKEARSITYDKLLTASVP